METRVEHILFWGLWKSHYYILIANEKNYQTKPANIFHNISWLLHEYSDGKGYSKNSLLLASSLFL